MSTQSYKVNKYTSVKAAFNQIKSEIAEVSFSENRESLALKLSFTYKEKELAFYYIFGNSQVTLVEMDEIFVLPTEIDPLCMKIRNTIEAFIKKVNKQASENS